MSKFGAVVAWSLEKDWKFAGLIPTADRSQLYPRNRMGKCRIRNTLMGSKCNFLLKIPP